MCWCWFVCFDSKTFSFFFLSSREPTKNVNCELNFYQSIYIQHIFIFYIHIIIIKTILVCETKVHTSHHTQWHIDSIKSSNQKANRTDIEVKARTHRECKKNYYQKAIKKGKRKKEKTKKWAKWKKRTIWNVAYLMKWNECT